MSKYAKEQYGVPADIGRKVIVNGRSGIIAADRGNYIGVNFDDQKAGVISNCHPTWEVTYLDMGKIRKMSRSQRRYQEYMEVGECYESFSHFLGIRQ